MTMLRGPFSTLILLHLALTFSMVFAQDDQSGFISIDCGITQGFNYTDDTTGINYSSDAGFIDSGVSRTILPIHNYSLDFQLSTLRSFPQNTRNCYNLRPQQGKGNRYLIRARFMYGNYDSRDQPPQFDLYLGPDHWVTVRLNDSTRIVNHEIIHVTSSDYIYVCLVNTDLGTPFISALEVRLFTGNMYENRLGSLILFTRVNFGTVETVRYGDDKYDRIWSPINWPNSTRIESSSTISPGPLTTEDPPSKVMSTAIIPNEPTDPLGFMWQTANSSDQFFIYIHLAEVEVLRSNQTREFNIYMNGYLWYQRPFSPSNQTTTISSISPSTNSPSHVLWINKTRNSTLPPLMNAMELYTLKQLPQRQTEDQDAAAIWNTKSMYGITRNWQGDPCAPQAFAWDGLQCSYNGTEFPRIIFLNLSSSRLSGEIAQGLANLTMIQSLDLSYNNLTGTVPDFLSGLSFLKILNLTGNNFTGPLPAELLAKSMNGSLTLRIDRMGSNNTSSCLKGSCKNNKHKKVVIPVIATVTPFSVLFIALAILWIVKKRKTQNTDVRDELLESRNQHFTYSEVQSITDNFKIIIGKGGFGTVYHGYIGANQVAVKMLSGSSAQGYREFQAEAYLLMSIHHKNLTPLVGYCNEGSHLGIICEYMANGNLERHLFDETPNVLSWKGRLQIGCDAAQGLEYMHHGCKPPIVHRDVKCTNILLNEKFEAKLADFGLSRAFQTDGVTHISTVVAGTPGYLDPEYFTTNRLTEKSDVYSFGVVLLELITSRPALSKEDQDSIYIIQWVNSMLAEGGVENIVDPRLQGDFDINSAWKVVELAMSCVASNKRPTMNNVVMELKDCLATEKSHHGTTLKNLDGYLSLNLESLTGPNPT